MKENPVKIQVVFIELKNGNKEAFLGPVISDHEINGISDIKSIKITKPLNSLNELKSDIENELFKNITDK